MKAWSFAVLLPVAILVVSSTVAAAEEAPKPVVAVFDIASDGFTLQPDLQKRLTKYLGVRLMMGGIYQVIPEGHLKEAMAALKIESQKDCYDEMCRVKLGNEAAANKNLNVTVWKVENKCSIIGAMYDLRAAASEEATEVPDLNCDEEGLKVGIQRFAAQLRGKASPSGGSGTAAGSSDLGAAALPPPPEMPAAPVSYGGDDAPPVKAETGYLAVEGSPKGARVDISGPSGFGTDGRAATSLPVRPFAVPAGVYQVSVSMTGYDNWDYSARVYADATEIVKADLVKSTGDVQISGNPEGARSRLECEKGFTREFGLPIEPWTVTVPHGTCRLTVERDGYTKYDESFEVQGGAVARQEVELARDVPRVVGGGSSAGAQGLSSGTRNRCDFNGPSDMCGWTADGNLIQTTWDRSGSVRFVIKEGAKHRTYNAGDQYDNASIEARIKVVSGSAGVTIGDAWSGDASSQHFFVGQIYLNGTYKIWQYSRGQWTSLATGNIPGSGRDFNVVRLQLVRGRLDFWVNGQYMNTVNVAHPKTCVSGVSLSENDTELLMDWVRVDPAR